ncbi:DMT family transporter [Aquihabitans sp. G128]|uniref:DMT family transporter n=1 Tax=Aquihabitans sp. G128 TaxID=2849779 RepID=UPI001C214D07|nr:DMT family transporter [Aquihabitans sp. G128]QXC60581.1 DMT family transporter [Aquihabitans sp. G128]
MERSSLGVVLGISAAAMFGASAPLAKELVGEVRPQLLAGLLYGGAAVALSAVLALRRSPNEARLRRADVPKLAGVTVAGGVLAPVLLLIGLERVSGVAGSLLLNLEAVLTLGLALAFFGEHLDRRAAAGAGAVVAAAAVLGLSGGESQVDVLGIVCIAAACLCWAVDNNLTQQLSGRDPFAIVRVKAAVAATVNLLLAVGLGAPMPAVGALVGAVVLGGAAYGLSVVLDAYALRWVGAAREAAFFGTAPVFGVATAVLVLGETITPAEGLAIAVMSLGIYLLVTERHVHRHAHLPLEHDHRHRHDDGHHDHVHDEPVLEHAHVHAHAARSHAHRHVSDVHHRHPHESD